MSEFTEKVEAKKEEEKVAVASSAAEENEEGEEGEDGPAPEEESTATFAPVVQLEVVEVKTHEEDEDVLYKQRAKLYQFCESLLDKGKGVKSWNEKGTGDIKLLKHRESERIRVLMRQEKTMKVVANHFLDPRIILTPNSGSDRSWVYVAYDFSDNELIEKTFALKFGSTEIAKEFKEAFEKGQAEMTALMKGLDSKEGAEEADEASKALASLDVKAADEGDASETAKKEADA